MPRPLRKKPERLVNLCRGRIEGAPSLFSSLLLAVLGTILAAGALSSSAQSAFHLARSVSGQFVIQSGLGVPRSPAAALLENDTNFVRLDPTILTVSCERIKQLVYRALGGVTPWSGKIFLRLYPAESSDSPVSVEAEQFRDGWKYRVSLPHICQRERYIRALVSVLLLEIANRQSTEHSAEVPPWLSEGLAREIWASNQREVILAPPGYSESGLRMSSLMVSARKINPLDLAHQELCSSDPLSFQQLSWPQKDRFTGEPGELYRSSAQVFLHYLLTLPKGQNSMRTMLQNLPRFYNWQFAFMEAFHDDFHEALDVEKWWSLQLAHFTGRALVETWTAEQSWEKLDESVRSAVQIRIGTNDLPLHAEVALQTIIRDWTAPRQTQVLEFKIRELESLRPRLVNEYTGIVDEYCQTLGSYLEKLSHPGFVLPFRKHAIAHQNADEALHHLDLLDQKRRLLRPETPPVQASNQAASP
jgi:hypothetical protein